jgi:small subunit ribosomal protein S17e
MGRIYGDLIKRVGEELLTKHPDLFNGDFESNKDKVKAALKTDSKKLINKVAGYITSKVNASNKTKVVSENEAEASSNPTQSSIQTGTY